MGTEEGGEEEEEEEEGGGGRGEIDIILMFTQHCLL